MENLEQDFLKYQAMTTPHPLALEIKRAKGVYITSTNGKKYLDFVAGVSACSLGHSHPKVISAIRKQINKYMHVMVYGEFAQQPTVQLCKELVSILPKNQQSIFLTNSGTEAIEGALKLAKKATSRNELIGSFKSYHGSTQGALSLLGSENQKEGYRPLIPGSRFIRFNNLEDLNQITSKTAAVILETIQGGAGCILPKNDYLKKVKKRCEEVGALLILDEIQPGFGRTGKLFGFQHFEISPDILVVGKGMGGGMPIGGFIASNELMMLLSNHPKLGHITTFGGNPVIASAALATLKELTETSLIKETLIKEKLFKNLLVHPSIKEIRGKGLMLALIVESPELASKLILKCKEKGVLLFWLLFENKAIRITPPLTISEQEIREGCEIILEVFDSI